MSFMYFNINFDFHKIREFIYLQSLDQHSLGMLDEVEN